MHEVRVARRATDGDGVGRGEGGNCRTPPRGRLCGAAAGQQHGAVARSSLLAARQQPGASTALRRGHEREEQTDGESDGGSI